MDLICDERPSDSPFIETVWRSRSETADPFISIAATQNSLVITQAQDKTLVTLRGPETHPTPAQGIIGGEFIGIQFKLGVFMPTIPPATLMDRHDLNLPDATHRKFYFNGATWEMPTFENIEGLIDRFAADGLLALDPQVSAILSGEPIRMTPRTAQRRFLQATGLTHGAIVQIERARYATALLKQGVPSLDAAFRAGYFDQPHMIRSLKRFVGLTPGQIIDKNRTESMSLLYNTSPFPHDTLESQGGHYEKTHRNRIYDAGWTVRSAGEMVISVSE